MEKVREFIVGRRRLSVKKLLWRAAVSAFLLTGGGWTRPTLSSVSSSLPQDGGRALLDSGPFAFRTGKSLFQDKDYEAAASALWRAVLLHEQTPPDERYDVQEAFQLFLQCYVAQNKVIEGFLFVAEESFQRGQTAMGQRFLEQALAVDPLNAEAHRLKELFVPADPASSASRQREGYSAPATFDEEFMKKSPEELYQIASGHFSNKEYEVRFRRRAFRRNGRTGIPVFAYPFELSLRTAPTCSSFRATRAARSWVRRVRTRCTVAP
jgi:hypothetical protein